MPTRDIANDLVIQEAISYQISIPTTNPGHTIDVAHYDSGIMFFLMIVPPLVPDGEFTPLLQHSDTGSSWSNIPAANLIKPDGDIGPLTDQTTTGEVKRLGAFGTKRYVRLSVVSVGTPTSSCLALGFCVKKPETRSLPAVTVAP